MAETHRLGSRAFLLFLGRRLTWPVILAAVLAGLWTQKDRVPFAYHEWTDYGLNILILLWIGLVVFVFLRSFFEYRGYSFRFDEEFFNVTRGYFIKHEIGIVYHQIQYVTVKCGILDRAMGVGHLIIVTSVGSSNPSLSEIVLPALDRGKAQLVQRELLRKAHPDASRKRVRSRSKSDELEESEEAEEPEDAEESEETEDED